MLRATSHWLTAADPALGECPPALRLAHYNAIVRGAGLRRDPEFRLREIRGERWKNNLAFLPIPRHRALVAVSAIDHHERHPLPQ